MVGPAVIAAGISAGSSLLGGLLNRSENRRRERRADPANVRKRFEAAGFNPLLGVGAMNAPVQYGPTMGDAVANAGSLAMSAYNQTHQLEMQRSELEMANQRLTELAEQSRLRPSYAGPYQRRAANPSRVGDADQTLGGARRANTSTLVPGSYDRGGGSRVSGGGAGGHNGVAETLYPVDGRTAIGGRVFADPLLPNQTERVEILPSEQYDIPWIRENPYMPAAGVITEQYGEPAEWLYALPKAVGDLGYTAYRAGQDVARETYNPWRRERHAARQRTASEIEDWWQAEEDWSRQSALRQQITTPSHIPGRVLRDVGTTNGWNQGVDTLRPLNRF